MKSYTDYFEDRKYLELCRETFGTDGDKVRSTFHYSRLTTYDKLVYSRILWAMMEHRNTIRVPGDNPQTSLDILEMVLFDNPLLFWFKDAYVESHFNSIDIHLEYHDSLWENRFFYLKEIHKIYEIFDVNIGPELDDYDIELIVHDMISSAIKYYQNSGREHSIVDVLVSGHGVCDSISYAVCYLLLMMGIECSVVAGKIRCPNDGGDGNHAWNIVKIDGEWYHLDVTCDLKINNDATIHRFFNLNDDMLFSTHEFEKGLCSALKNNYYVRTRAVFNNFNDVKNYINEKKNSSNVIELIATWIMTEDEVSRLDIPGWVWWVDNNCYVFIKS